MAVSVVFNGVTYSVPSIAGESGYATTLSAYLQALASGAATTSTVRQAIRTATTTPITVAAATDFTIICNMTSASAVQVNLPAGVAKQIFVIVDGKGDAATNGIVITGNGGQQINGQTNYLIQNNFGGVALQFDGTSWKAIWDFVGNGPRFTSISLISSGTLAGSPLASSASTNTFTNKTFDVDGTGNSLTNIANANIKTGAGIARAKLANGTNGAVLINDPSTGALSEESVLARTRGGTGITSTATFPSSGTIVTRDATETLTNKTLSNPTINGGPVTGVDFNGSTASNASRLTIPRNTKSTLDALTRRLATIVYASDQNVLYIDNGSTLLPIGANWTVATAQTPAGGAALTISLTTNLQVIPVSGSGGPVTLSTTPFGTSAPANGTVVRLVCTSNTNTVTVPFNNAANGALTNGAVELSNGSVVEFQFVADRWYQVAFNNVTGV